MRVDFSPAATVTGAGRLVGWVDACLASSCTRCERSSETISVSLEASVTTGCGCCCGSWCAQPDPATPASQAIAQNTMAADDVSFARGILTGFTSHTWPIGRGSGPRHFGKKPMEIAPRPPAYPAADRQVHLF